jgi:hypothetical protein
VLPAVEMTNPPVRVLPLRKLIVPSPEVVRVPVPETTPETSRVVPLLAQVWFAPRIRLELIRLVAALPKTEIPPVPSVRKLAPPMVTGSVLLEAKTSDRIEKSCPSTVFTGPAGATSEVK